MNTNFYSFWFDVDPTENRARVFRFKATKILVIIFIYLPSDVISQEKTAISSRSITKASKYAIPLKPTHKLAESKRYLVSWKMQGNIKIVLNSKHTKKNTLTTDWIKNKINKVRKVRCKKNQSGF